MKTYRIVALIASALVAGLALPAVAADEYKIDSSHSTVLFAVSHLNTSNFYGRFNDVQGSFSYDEKNPGKMSFDVTVKADSIDTANSKRDQHLKSPDFFNVKQFPTLTFKSKKIKFLGQETFEVVGDLTCRGVTKEMTVKLTHTGAGKDPWGGYRCGFETSFTIKRADFGMDYMPNGLGNEIKITVSLEGIKK